MQKLTGDRLSQVESAAVAEFDHPPDRLPAAFQIKAAVARKAGQSGGKNFVDGLEIAGGELLLDDSFVLGFKLDRHTFNLALSGAGRKLVAR